MLGLPKVVHFGRQLLAREVRHPSRRGMVLVIAGFHVGFFGHLFGVHYTEPKISKKQAKPVFVVFPTGATK